MKNILIVTLLIICLSLCDALIFEKKQNEILTNENDEYENVNKFLRKKMLGYMLISLEQNTLLKGKTNRKIDSIYYEIQ